MPIIKEWENRQDSTRFPRLAEFIDFLERKSKTFETVERVSGKIAGSNATPSPTESKLPNAQRSRSISPARTKPASCLCCNKSQYPSVKCNKFLNMTVRGRRDFVLRHSLCLGRFNTYRSGHRCNVSRRNCGRNHHRLVHADFQRNGIALVRTNASNVGHKAPCASISTVLSNCLLATARVKMSAGNRVRDCTALLDSGSNCNQM